MHDPVTRVALLAFLLFIATPGLAQFDHGTWDGLLARHVVVLHGGVATRLDYGGVARDRALLDAYLESLAGVEREAFYGWPSPERLAFLINAYNAWTVALVLTRHPDLDSIRDLGSLLRSPWSRDFIPLFGATVSLDHIEHDLIRGPGGFGEPRIHFAVNCASVGCPALRPQAYVGHRLEEQIEEATVLFLSDRERNRLDGRILRVSEIFDWYAEDFEAGWRGTDGVAGFLARYGAALGLDETDAGALRSGAMRIRFLDYDWSLNDAAR